MRFRFVGAGLAPAFPSAASWPAGIGSLAPASHSKIIATTLMQMDFARRNGSASVSFHNHRCDGILFAMAQRQVESHAGGSGNDQMRATVGGATNGNTAPKGNVNSRLRQRFEASFFGGKPRGQRWVWVDFAQAVVDFVRQIDLFEEVFAPTFVSLFDARDFDYVNSGAANAAQFSTLQFQ